MNHRARLISTLTSALTLTALLSWPAPASAQWVAFNDHAPGTIGANPGTSPNATIYRSDAAGGGPLTNVVSGLGIAGVSVAVTRSAANITPAGTVTRPNAGSPAALLFDGLVDFQGTPNPAVQTLPGGEVVITFNGLNSTKRYRFTGTAVRGNNYADRWILISLGGADTFVSAHTYAALVLTNGTPGVTLETHQVALNTGENRVGSLANWENIAPGGDGSISITNRQYQGTVPGGSSGGPYGYAITGWRLEEFDVTESMLTLTGQPTPMVVNEGQTATFTATVTGGGAVYRWYKEPNPNPIPNATGPTLTIPNCLSGNAGTYYVTASNMINQVESDHTSTLIVNSDLTPPLVTRALLSNDLVTILVTFSEPVQSAGPNDGAQDTANYVVFTTVPGDGPAIGNAAFQAGSGQRAVVITLGGPVTAGTVFNLQLENIRDLAENMNVIDPSPTVVPILQATLPFMNFSGQNWKYNFSMAPVPSDWFSTTFNDGSWSNAPAPFDNTHGAGRATIPTSLLAVNFNIPLTNSVEGVGGPGVYSHTNKVPSYYFRTTFNYPYDPAQSLLILRTVVDDAASIYLNGELAFRLRTTPATEAFDAYSGAAAGNGAIEGAFILPTTNLFNGANKIAVLLKQGTLASSDATMALELSAYAQDPVDPAPTISIAPGAVSWTDAAAVLEYATALDNDPNDQSEWGDVSTVFFGGGPVPNPLDPATLPASPTGNYFFRLRR